MSDNEDYDSYDNQHSSNQAEQRQKPKFDVYNHYHDVVDGSRISHFVVQNDVFCIVSAGGVTNSSELYIRDTAADALKRMPLPCTVSGLFLDMSGQHVFVTSTAGDLYYVNVQSMNKPGRVIQGGPGSPVIHDVFVLGIATSPDNEPGANGLTVRALLALRNGAIQYIRFQSDQVQQFSIGGGGGNNLTRIASNVTGMGGSNVAPSVVVTTQCVSLGKGSLPVTAVEAIASDIECIVLATTPVGLYQFQGPDAVGATKDQVPREVIKVQSNLTTFEPTNGRPLHVVRAFPESQPTGFTWSTASAVVHGCFDKEKAGKISFFQQIPFPFTKDIRTRQAGSSQSLGAGDRAPLQVSTTAFHMFLRYENRVAILRVPPGLPWRPRVDPAAAEARRLLEKSGKLTETFAEFDWNDRHIFDFGRKGIKILGIVRDVENRRLYAFSDTFVWNLSLSNERIDIWRLFFERAVDKDEPKWENRVRYYFAAANLAPKNSRERDLVYFHLGRAAYNYTKPGRGALESLGWSTTADLENLAVQAFSKCSMFDEIVLLIRQSSTLLPKFIEKRLAVLLESGTAGPQQLALLVTFALLLRLEPRMDVAMLTSAAQRDAMAQMASAKGNTSQIVRKPANAQEIQQAAAASEAAQKALEKLVQDLKKHPKLLQLLNDNFFYKVVTRLLESLGHMDKSLELAIATARYRDAVSHHNQMREYKQASQVLVEYCCTKPESVQLWYDFAGQIVENSRDDIFKGLRKIVKNMYDKGFQVDFRRFIPAFISYDESRIKTPDIHEHKVVSLISLIIKENQPHVVVGNGLPRVLNDLFLSILFVMLGDARKKLEENRLRNKGNKEDSDEDADMTDIIDGQIDEVLGTDHDESAIESLPDVSLEYALRRCVELGHIGLSIRLYRLLKMPEQALTASLLLNDGLECALEFLEELRESGATDKYLKSLWMLLTQLVLADKSRAHDSTADTRLVLSLIQRSNNILKLEEVIVLLDAQEALQDFRKAVCDSLNSYSEQIKSLTEQMSQATKLAQSLRNDLDNLDHQFGYVTVAQRCNYCKTALIKANHDPFVVFPTCRHAFHYRCGKKMFDKNFGLMEMVCRSLEMDPNEKDSASAPLWQKCFEGECPYCGEWAIQRITAPLGDDLVSQ